MKKRLQRIYWLSILMTLVMTIAAVTLMIKLKIDDTREELRATLNVAAALTLESDGDLQAIADEIAGIAGPMRVTYLMANGLVLADSHRDPRTMNSHAGRPEIVQALQTGVGESLRLSDTEAMFMYYEAMSLSDELILRLCYPVEEITRMIMFYIIGMCVLFLLLYVMQRRAFSSIASDMRREMDGVQRLLDGSAERPQAVFPELQPAMNNIAFRAGRLHDDLEEVRRTLGLRQDFVAHASHELRSPLTSIMGFAEMMDEGLADTPEEKQLCLRTIRSECSRMLEVIEDILLLSRSERQTVQRTLVDATAIAGEILNSLGPRAAHKGIRLTMQGETMVLAAEKDVWEMLYNLIDNAIHYGRPGGYVRVVLSGERIEVEDDGVGIAPEHQAHIFEKFYRVDEARDARGDGTGGSGLGLSIVKSLAERNGAEVSVRSEPGAGSCFTLRFAQNDPQERGEKEGQE
ncbi:MAG: hypothetical protein IJO02_06830 [Clostridia bacterium]|nr:hypothetical protein [Clostridia bacterium]